MNFSEQGKWKIEIEILILSRVDCEGVNGKMKCSFLSLGVDIIAIEESREGSLWR